MSNDFDVLITIGQNPWGFPCDDAVLKRAVISEERYAIGKRGGKIGGIWAGESVLETTRAKKE
jgi:hypothetical protein